MALNMIEWSLETGWDEEVRERAWALLRHPQACFYT